MKRAYRALRALVESAQARLIPEWQPPAGSRAAVLEARRPRLSPVAGEQAPPIVFVFIGGVPNYVEDALFQARLWNPASRIILVGDTSAAPLDLSHYGVEVVSEATLRREIPLVNQLVEALSVPGAKDTLRGAEGWCLRYVYLAGALRYLGVDDGVWHPEADNTLYTNLASTREVMSRFHAESVAVTPAGHGVAAPGMLWVPRVELAETLARRLTAMVLETRSMSDAEVVRYVAPDPTANAFGHVGEMKADMGFLYLLSQERPPLVSFLPTVPHALQGYFTNEEVLACDGVFDACSYGQYLGGLGRLRRRLEHVGFASRHHFSGKEIRDQTLTLQWGTSEDGLWYPYVKDPAGRHWRIFNLHIYSKNLRRFANDYLEHHPDGRLIPPINEQPKWGVPTTDVDWFERYGIEAPSRTRVGA